MKYLLDTNVLSELRRPEPDRSVMHWYDSTADADLHLSVMTIGEFRKGLARLRRKDPDRAAALALWLDHLLAPYASRILPVTPDVANVWGELNDPDPLPVIDAFIAATAIVHDMVLVTRNVKDFQRTGVRLLNPFD
ncbi:type II toxin-antitoxin system VapC family toxin [Glycomyces sp. NPDC049804]|uniref:type II toxin-antitoxin system VapC family toxin n=1 Tax=Glycomyces sp. NPDC049804 TaxID=3154363 RepID=UPI00343129AD